MLLENEAFRAALEDNRGAVSPAEVEALVAKMATSSAATGATVGLDRYVEVLHAWNVFNAVDVLREGALDPKELRNLLLFQHRQEPGEKQLDRMGKVLRGDAPESTTQQAPITRDSWISANLAVAH